MTTAGGAIDAIATAVAASQASFMHKKQISRTSFKNLHENGFDHLKRFMKFERDYNRSRKRLTAMELAVYLVLGLFLAIAWTVYPIFERLR